MCGLFGFVRYGNTIKNLSDITNSLAEQSAIRGTDATGIAFNDNGLKIVKDGKSAYEINFKHSDEIHALIGHTRHSTQGSEKKNCNNHPFPGKVNGFHFALAHNGVLSNDEILRKTLNLPKTKIETDSYIAAQLLMSGKKLDFESLRYMAETVHGSFLFYIFHNRKFTFMPARSQFSSRLWSIRRCSMNSKREVMKKFLCPAEKFLKFHRLES